MSSLSVYSPIFFFAHFIQRLKFSSSRQSSTTENISQTILFFPLVWQITSLWRRELWSFSSLCHLREVDPCRVKCMKQSEDRGKEKHYETCQITVCLDSLTMKDDEDSVNLHHEVINVHGPGSFLTEISFLQNTLNLLADAEVCWNLLSTWSTRVKLKLKCHRSAVAMWSWKQRIRLSIEVQYKAEVLQQAGLMPRFTMRKSRDNPKWSFLQFQSYQERCCTGLGH